LAGLPGCLFGDFDLFDKDGALLWNELNVLIGVYLGKFCSRTGSGQNSKSDQDDGQRSGGSKTGSDLTSTQVEAQANY
jgi:hypothetical protein